MTQTQRPNLLVITTHDTGRHFGCYGIPTLHTPAIDRLADQGVQLTNYFATVPICAASRTSMLTGQYPQTHGQLDLPLFGFEYHDHVQHLSNRMQQAGYQTALIGVQHETRKVERLGFDQMQPQHKRAPNVAQATCDYLQQIDRDRPFYLQVGLYETHSPFNRGWIEPDHRRGVYVPPYIKPTGAAYELLAELQGAIRQVDLAVEQIDQTLHEAGLADNTLIVFTTDHGVELPRAKWHLYDPGLEIAMIARWPKGGVAGGRSCDALSSNLDFTPTVLDLLGIPGDDSLQGRSMADLWRGQSDDPINGHIFGYYHKTGSRSIRTNTHKLIINTINRPAPRVPVDIADTSRNTPASEIELFDLMRDPLESTNLAGDSDYAAVRDELLGRLWAWMEQTDDQLLQGPVEMPKYGRVMARYQQWQSQHQTSPSPD